MYTNIFDTHAHYDDERFSEDIDNVLTALPAVGICHVVNCATHINSCEKSRLMASEYEYIYFAAGIHPHESGEAQEDFINELKGFAAHEKCVAIGEIGLDYHYDFSPREIQKSVFEKQLILAKELSLPVIIHDREAHSDTWELLKKYKPQGIVHCFSGSVEMARDIVNLGMSIGLGGAVTFKNAKKPVDVAKYVPLDKLVLETDCPYLTPHPHRGEVNEPKFVELTCQKIAMIKGILTSEVDNITTQNAHRIFPKL